MTTFTPGDLAIVVGTLPGYAESVDIPVKVTSVDQAEIEVALDLEEFPPQARSRLTEFFRIFGDLVEGPHDIRLYFDTQTLQQIRTPSLPRMSTVDKRLTKRVMPVGRDS